MGFLAAAHAGFHGVHAHALRQLDHAGAVVAGAGRVRAHVFRRRVEAGASRTGQHGYAGRAQHVDRLSVQSVQYGLSPVLDRAGAGTACLLRGLLHDHSFRPAGQVARGAGQGKHLVGYQEADGIAAFDRPPVGRRHRAGRSDSDIARRGSRVGASRGEDSGRRHGRKRRIVRRREHDYRRAAARR